MDLKALVSELKNHALGRKGAEAADNEVLSEFVTPRLRLPGTTWGDFFEITSIEGRPCIIMPVTEPRLAELLATYPTIRQSNWMPRDGHVQMEVPLTAGISTKFLKILINESHLLIWRKLGAAERFTIDRQDAPFDNVELLNQLIDLHQLSDHRVAIHQIARRALLLRTRAVSEAMLPLGATKFGGLPDLPPECEWPIFGKSKPLAFLGQINLQDVAAFGQIIEGLPEQGTLSFFSVWGWVSEDEADPQTPSRGWQSQTGWTKLIHTPPGAKLERRDPPRRLHLFRAVEADPALVLSLPNHRMEPALTSLGWPDDVYERFDDMQSQYRATQLGFWLNNTNSLGTHHLIGGYALFQQQYPADLPARNATMLLQVGSDHHSDMCWGDEGELAIHCDADALRRGRFERPWVEFQCG